MGNFCFYLCTKKLVQIVLVTCLLPKMKQQIKEYKEGRGCLVSQSTVMGKP